MDWPRSRSHEQLPGNDLVAVAVVGERPNQLRGPASCGLRHAHIVLGSSWRQQGPTPTGQRARARDLSPELPDAGQRNAGTHRPEQRRATGYCGPASRQLPQVALLAFPNPAAASLVVLPVARRVLRHPEPLGLGAQVLGLLRDRRIARVGREPGGRFGELPGCPVQVTTVGTLDGLFPRPRRLEANQRRPRVLMIAREPTTIARALA